METVIDRLHPAVR